MLGALRVGQVARRESRDRLPAASASAVNPVIRFTDVRKALVHGCRSPETDGSFVCVEGQGSQRIKLMANDLAAAKKAVELGSGVREDAVRLVKSE